MFTGRPPDATVGYGPGHEMLSEIRPLPVQNVNDQLDQFLRWYRGNVRGGPQQAAPARPSGFGANANVGGPSRMTDAHNSRRSEIEKLQLQKLQGEVRDAADVRNLRPSPTMLTPQMGGGVIYGYDQMALSPIQREAVIPENASMLSGGLSDAQVMGTAEATGGNFKAPSAPTVIGNGNTFEQERMLQALKRTL